MSKASKTTGGGGVGVVEEGDGNASSSSTSSAASQSAPTSSEIKYVKFKNYGLHKSLGENLNNIEQIIISGGSSATSSGVRHLHSNSSGVGVSHISKSTMNLTSTNASSFIESGFYESNNTSVHWSNSNKKSCEKKQLPQPQQPQQQKKQQQQQQPEFTSAAAPPSSVCNRANRYSLCQNYKNEFNLNRNASGGSLSNSRNNRNPNAPSAPLNSRSMFKSCSPQRSTDKRASQVDYRYASPIVIRRAQTNFSRFEPAQPVAERLAVVAPQKVVPTSAGSQKSHIPIPAGLCF
jgi:hypothetical protein